MSIPRPACFNAQLWYQVQQAVDGALRARLVELAAESVTWPCDPSAATKVVLKAVATGSYGQKGGSDRAVEEGVSFNAYLKPNELQDLADNVSTLLELQAKHGINLRFKLMIEADGGVKMSEAVTAELRKLLEGIPW